jgi:sorbitol/mannitol transport system permease protein
MTTATPTTPSSTAAGPAGPARPARSGRRFGSGALTVFTWLVALVFFMPVLWMFLSSFKQEAEAASNPPTFLFVPTLDQYSAILGADIGRYFLNSATATVVSTVLVLLLAVPAAYAVSIRPVAKTEDVLFFFISTKMLPVVAVIVPIYVVAGRLHVLDNVGTLVFLYTAMNLPLAVWMMRSFFQEVPREVLEAAQMDGASLMTTLRTILLPMVAPGVAATALLCVILAWNEFFFALNLTAVNAATVPVMLVSTMTSEGLFLARISAASVLASLPVLIAGWIAQKQLVRGLSMGAIK